MNFSEQEKEFLVKILSQLTVNASDPGSIATAQTVQSIITKLKEPIEAPKE